MLCCSSCSVLIICVSIDEVDCDHRTRILLMALIEKYILLCFKRCVIMYTVRTGVQLKVRHSVYSPPPPPPRQKGSHEMKSKGEAMPPIFIHLYIFFSFCVHCMASCYGYLYIYSDMYIILMLQLYNCTGIYIVK